MNRGPLFLDYVIFADSKYIIQFWLLFQMYSNQIQLVSLILTMSH